MRTRPPFWLWLVALLLLCTPAPAADRRPEGFEAALAARAGRPQTVDLSSLKSELRLMPEGEVAEQVRDWAMVAAAAGMSPDLAAGLAIDLPPAVRRSYLAGLREFPYGPGRVAMLAPDECLILVPAVRREGNPVPGFDPNVACRLLDARRLMEGKIPATVRVTVYEAVADRDHPRLTITYLGRLNGADFDTPAYGFVTAKVATGDMLAEFLDRTDDLLEVRYNDGIVLTGRKYPPSIYHRPYHRLEVTDIRTILNAVSELLSDDLSPETRARLDADSEYKALSESEKKSVVDLLKQMSRSSKDRNAIGFSLDPWLNPKPLAKALQALLGRHVLSRAAVAPLRKKLEAVTKALDSAQPFRIPERSDLDPTGLYALMDELRNPSATLPAAARGEIEQALEELERLAKVHRMQCPRYEGKIEGTSVGMTLYYTDLTAKLYAMSAIQARGGKVEPLSMPPPASSPLVAVTAVKVAPFYVSEYLANPYGRLWWGVKTAGFVIEDRGQVRFAPVATTLFMKSKPNQTATEVDANLVYETFCSGWNRHYLPIADWNPEYHRLNELMKWNVALMAAYPGQAKAWAFLADGSLGRITSFAGWYLDALKDGRVGDRITLPFLAGLKGAPPDSLEIIRSVPFSLGGLSVRVSALTGGVTGPRIKEVESRVVPVGEPAVRGVPAEVKVSDKGIGAAWTGGKPIPLENGGTIARELEGRQVILTAGKQVKLRSPAIEFPPAKPDEPPAVYRPRVDPGPEPGSLVLEGSLERGAERTDLGQLVASPAGPDSVKFEWQPRGIDRDQAVLARIAGHQSIEPGLAQEIRYDAANRRLYIRSGEPGEGWLEVEPGNSGGPPPPRGPAMKLGSPGEPDWFFVRRISDGDVRSAPAVVIPEPRYARVRPERSGSGVTSRDVWIPPRPASPIWKLDGGEIYRAANGDLIASRGPAHDLVARLSARDLGGLNRALSMERFMQFRVLELNLNDGNVVLVRHGDAFKVGTPADSLLGPVKSGEPGLRQIVALQDNETMMRVGGDTLYLFNKAGEVTPEARDVLRILRENPRLTRYAEKLGRVDAGRLREVQRVQETLRSEPVLRATVENGQVVTRDPKTGFDLREAVRAANRGEPLPPQVKDYVGSGKAIDVSGLNARQIAGLRAQLRTIRQAEPEFTRLLDSGLEGSARRKAGLLDWEKIEVGADHSLGKVIRHGEIAREILGDFKADLSGGRSIEFTIAHADQAGSYFNQAMRRVAAGEFRGKHVAAAMCDMSPEQVIALRDAVLKNGGLSFITVDETINIPAATLAATRLGRNPGAVGAVTPSDVPKVIYAEASAVFERCLKEAKPIDAIRREFGRRAGDFFLDGNGQLDNATIEKTREAFQTDWLKYIETVDATDVLRPVAPSALAA